MNPFITNTTLPWVALVGPRQGYIQLAPSHVCESFAALSPELFTVAQAWACQLEALGAARVLWLTLAEVTHHKHIHLYPRWPDDSLQGVALFEARENTPQPLWSETSQTALAAWAQQHQVHLIQP
jgi:diadenosine tetraphosphate (Ap4A) HIT family hydrolase